MHFLALMLLLLLTEEKSGREGKDRSAVIDSSCIASKNISGIALTISTICRMLWFAKIFCVFGT